MEQNELRVATGVGQLRVRTGGTANGPVALFWPSLFTDGVSSWGPQIAALEAGGWQTIVIDPPGHGGSDRPPAHFTMESCAAAALQILDTCKVQQAAFLGISWGGFVALRVALSTPERLTALVLINTSAERSPFLIRQRDRILPLLVRAGFPIGQMTVQTLLAPATRRQNPELAIALAGQINRLDKIGLARAIQAVLIERSDVLKDLDTIKIPTLVIAGGLDQAIPAKYADHMAASISGARSERLADAAHLSTRDAPQTVIELICDFLE